MDDYTVRPATRDDLPAVLTVLAQNRATPQPYEPIVDVSGAQAATWGRMQATADLTVYLAEATDEPVGTASLLAVPTLGYGCRPTAFIEPVVVAYAHRRRGVARLMLERALADAAGLGCHKVQLLSHKRHADDGAHDLYRSVGFTAEAEGFRRYL